MKPNDTLKTRPMEEASRCSGPQMRYEVNPREKIALRMSNRTPDHRFCEAEREKGGDDQLAGSSPSILQTISSGKEREEGRGDFEGMKTHEGGERVESSDVRVDSRNSLDPEKALRSKGSNRNHTGHSLGDLEERRGDRGRKECQLKPKVEEPRKNAHSEKRLVIVGCSVPS